MNLVRLSLVATAALALLAGACGKSSEAPPPERVTTITTGRVTQKDIPLVESAVGMESALGQALDYDPTRVQTQAFVVRLPFPEHVARRLAAGQVVRLSTFDDPSRTTHGQIREIRPALNATTQTRDVIVAVPGGNWRPLGSIRGEVTLGVRQGARVVPEQAVVLRPAGSVIYVIENDRAVERAVTTGVARDGYVEIVRGAQGGETVAVDGASLLSSNAKIKIRENKTP